MAAWNPCRAVVAGVRCRAFRQGLRFELPAQPAVAKGDRFQCGSKTYIVGKIERRDSRQEFVATEAPTPKTEPKPEQEEPPTDGKRQTQRSRAGGRRSPPKM